MQRLIGVGRKGIILENDNKLMNQYFI